MQEPSSTLTDMESKLNKKGFEAPWWAFLVGLLVALFVAILILLFIGKIKLGGEGVLAALGEKLSELF